MTLFSFSQLESGVGFRGYAAVPITLRAAVLSSNNKVCFPFVQSQSSALVSSNHHQGTLDSTVSKLAGLVAAYQLILS